MIKKDDYLLNIYYTGEDNRDPMTLPSWFGFLLSDGYVKVLQDSNKVVITEKGLLYVESLGLVPEHPLHVADNKRFQKLLDEAMNLLNIEKSSHSYSVVRSEWMAEFQSKLFDCKELANRLQ